MLFLNKKRRENLELSHRFSEGGASGAWVLLLGAGEEKEG
ncbi:hypothetical protein SLEP1_g26358 [Rubroshorea leprosula]|uniref:Uncharacterized protein n=1 Tax=Rubroshorea leprosula TaxID=152421 RepID=A0AAV5JLU5_9ROSI|nr:hypothetical protein SLEP1_g26358 [Rubroshorea leprosula]